MSRRATIALLIALAVLAAVLGFRWQQQFKRLQQVAIGTTPIQLGTISRMTLSNPSSSKVEWELRCYVNTHEQGQPAPAERLTLLPQETREFDLYPEHAADKLPVAIANKTCTALWRGPFGWERRAWRVMWQYARPPSKQLL